MNKPRKELDEQSIIEHVAIGYTMKELEALTGVSEDTLMRRYADVIKRGRFLRDASLRRKQFEVAQAGNPTMLIWLGKQYLEQADKQDVSHDWSGTTYGDLPIPTGLSPTHKPN